PGVITLVWLLRTLAPARGPRSHRPDRRRVTAMAVFHPYTTKCACGTTLTVHLAESINVKRSPVAREAILRGELHRARCPGCERRITVEKPFYYTDLTRSAFFLVAPRRARHHGTMASPN